jgi:shikimate kinase
MLPNLVLIGFMGCGKSSIGRRLTGITGHRLLDSDDLVVQAEGRSIPQIFAAEGEAYFRTVEQRVILESVGLCGVIFSTGGGAILNAENRAALRQIGVVAWIDADPDVLFERASRSGRRPLLQTENPRQAFDTLLAARRDLYTELADLRIDSTRMGHDETAHAVLEEALRCTRRFEC